MKRITGILKNQVTSGVFMALFLSLSVSSHAAPLKVNVAPFNVVGAQNRDEMKTTLQGLLSSRLNQEQVAPEENPSMADFVITGSYARFGSMFSIDLMIKEAKTGRVAKIFEQGEGDENIIPAINRLSRKAESELARLVSPPAATVAGQAASPSASLPVPATLPPNRQGVAVISPPVSPSAGMKREVPPAVQTQESPRVLERGGHGGFAIKSEGADISPDGSWTSEPLEGNYNSMALGRRLPGGELEIFIADEHLIRYYLKGEGKGLRLVSEVRIPVPSQVLGIDTADIDGDRIPEIYVSIIDREKLASRVYTVDGKELKLVSDRLAWFFRGIGNDYASRVIYGQELGTKGEFYGGVARIRMDGKRLEAGKSLPLPRYAHIFNFNLLNGSSGGTLFTSFNEEGYLTVTDPKGEEIWKSIEKYGGSETSFKFRDYALIGDTGSQYRIIFLEQRTVTMDDGMMIVPRNEGMFVIGNARSYNRNTLLGLRWQGTAFKEMWHTKTEPGYLADFAYDPVARSVVMLEITRKSGLSGKGKSTVSINRID